jgi:hypothetical protein
MSPSTDRPLVRVWAWRFFSAVMILAYLALAVSETLFIKASSANIPISDTWGFVPVLARFALTGHLAWKHVFSFYGDGRPVLERLGLLVSAKYFTLNVQMVKSVSVLMGLAEAACAVWAFRLALPRSRLAVVLLAALPVAILIFSFNNWQNLLDEWNVMNLAAVALVFLALVVVVQLRYAETRSWLWMLAAVLVCAVASFSGESGTFSWILCVVLLWLPKGRRRAIENLVFSATAAVFLVVYFLGTTVGSGHPSHHLGKVLNFALICLGNGVVGAGLKELSLARAVGIAEVAMVLVLAVPVIVQHVWEDRAVLIGAGLAAFGLLGAVATGVSRLQIGIGTAVSSRYIALTAPTAFGIYLVLVRWLSLRGPRETPAVPRLKRAGLWALPCLVAAAFCASGLISDVKVARVAPDKRAYYLELQAIACDPLAYSNANLAKFDHAGSPLRPRERKLLLAQIADLKRARLSVFSDDYCKAYAPAGKPS